MDAARKREWGRAACVRKDPFWRWQPGFVSAAEVDVEGG